MLNHFTILMYPHNFIKCYNLGCQVLTITDLYDGVWCDEIVSGTSDKTVANSIDVLKVLHPNLFTKEDPKAKGKLFITTLDASELL